MEKALDWIAQLISANPILSAFDLLWFIGSAAVFYVSIQLLAFTISRERARRRLKLNGVTKLLSDQSIRHALGYLYMSLLAFGILAIGLHAPVPKREVMRFGWIALTSYIVLNLYLMLVTVIVDMNTLVRINDYYHSNINFEAELDEIKRRLK